MYKPNSVTNKNGTFYISYNSIDSNVYGSDTTALVFGQMENFYILNGDHRNAYKEFETFKSCLMYFMDNISLINKYSERPKDSRR